MIYVVVLTSVYFVMPFNYSTQMNKLTPEDNTLKNGMGSGPGAEVSKIPVFQEWKSIALRSGVLDQNYLPIRIPRNRNPTQHISWYPGSQAGAT